MPLVKRRSFAKMSLKGDVGDSCSSSPFLHCSYEVSGSRRHSLLMTVCKLVLTKPSSPDADISSWWLNVSCVSYSDGKLAWFDKKLKMSVPVETKVNTV